MSSMSLEEATYYWNWGMSEGETCPTLEVEEARSKAYNDNPALLGEAMTVYMAAYPEKFPPGASLHPSGSLFCGSALYRGIYIHWDSEMIHLSHEGFRYTVTTPFHLAALHAIRDPELDFTVEQTWKGRPSYSAAVAYILENHDTRVAWRPRRMVVPEGWHPDVWPWPIHPGEKDALQSGAVHDPVRFPFKSDVTAAAHAAGKYETTRYTVFGWRKQAAFLAMEDWLERQRFMVEHCDLEVLDAEKRVASSEWAADYQIDIERPRL